MPAPRRSPDRKESVVARPVPPPTVPGLVGEAAGDDAAAVAAPAATAAFVAADNAEAAAAADEGDDSDDFPAAPSAPIGEAGGSGPLAARAVDSAETAADECCPAPLPSAVAPPPAAAALAALAAAVACPSSLRNTIRVLESSDVSARPGMTRAPAAPAAASIPALAATPPGDCSGEPAFKPPAGELGGCACSGDSPGLSRKSDAACSGAGDAAAYELMAAACEREPAPVSGRSRPTQPRSNSASAGPGASLLPGTPVTPTCACSCSSFPVPMLRPAAPLPPTACGGKDDVGRAISRPPMLVSPPYPCPWPPRPADVSGRGLKLVPNSIDVSAAPAPAAGDCTREAPPMRCGVNAMPRPPPSPPLPGASSAL